MELHPWQDRPVRITDVGGRVFEGVADVYSAEYDMHEFGVEEEGVSFGSYLLFEKDILRIEPLDPALLCGFYGAEWAPERLRALYRDLREVWCIETCAPRLRGDWSRENPTLGQCSITAFLVRDLFGGLVRGVPLPDGGVHCFNEIDDDQFDLTSEQFGEEELDYDDRPEQSREKHFADLDKLARYELLKKRLESLRAAKEETT
jgi:hypothetical protein